MRTDKFPIQVLLILRLLGGHCIGVLRKESARPSIFSNGGERKGIRTGSYRFTEHRTRWAILVYSF